MYVFNRLREFAQDLVVAWAECHLCKKERITTRMFEDTEEYTCGAEATWANIRLGQTVTLRVDVCIMLVCMCVDVCRAEATLANIRLGQTVSLRVDVCVYVCVYVAGKERGQTCVFGACGWFLYMLICVCVCLYIYIYIFILSMDVYMNIYVYTHIHMHTCQTAMETAQDTRDIPDEHTHIHTYIHTSIHVTGQLFLSN